MTISFHPSLDARPSTGWADRIRLAREAGFSATDVDLDAMADEDPAAVRHELEAAGMEACASPLPLELRQDERTFQAGFGRFVRLAEFAAEIGVKTMHRSLPAVTDRPASEFASVLRRRWNACATVAQEHGIVLAVEPLGTLYRRRAGTHEFIWRLEDAAVFARSCAPGVGVLVDSWHWHLAGSTARDIVSAGPHIVHVHVADVPERPVEALRDDERVLPGDGVVDFAEFFEALDQAGYHGFVSPELPGRWSDSMSPLESARVGLAASLSVIGLR